MREFNQAMNFLKSIFTISLKEYNLEQNIFSYVPKEPMFLLVPFFMGSMSNVGGSRRIK